MGWKCLPQLTGMVRGEPKPKAKHRSNGAAICGEAGSERHSASNTLDRSLSKYNQYGGYTKGADCWAAMEAAAEQYRVEGTSRAGKKFSRKLRGDAVIGWAMIFKPPMEVAADWPMPKRKKFVRDSWAAMAKIEPRLFRKENIMMQAVHRDEGVEHFHVIGNALDDDGRYCGNLVDAALMVRICEQYPAMMRAEGWDIEDAELTDFSRMGKNPDGTYRDPEYRAQVKARKRGGKSVNEYAEQVAREKREAAATAFQDAQKALQDARKEAGKIISDAKEKAQEAVQEAVQGLEEREAAVAVREDDLDFLDRQRLERRQRAREQQQEQRNRERVRDGKAMVDRMSDRPVGVPGRGPTEEGRRGR